MTTTVPHTSAVPKQQIRRAPARIGLVGAGGIGRAHAQAAADLPGAVLAGVCDLDPTAAAALAAEHGAATVTLAELAEPGRLDLVVVASPPSTHPDVVEPLLAAGVPVMCEKPFAITTGAARRMATLSEQTGTPLTMATKFRFVEDVQRTRELIADGALGKLLKVEVSFASRVEMAGRWNCDPEVSGGGVLIDNATHGVDLVRYLAGPLVEVFAVPGPAGQQLEVEDSATLLGRTASGVLVQVDVTWTFRRLSPVYCAVYGTSGSVEIGWQGARAVTAGATEPHTFGSGYRKIESLRANLSAVLDALAAGRPAPVTAADAVAAAAVIDAGYASARLGRWTEVVDIRELPSSRSDAAVMVNHSRFVHPTALVEDGALVGPGTRVWDNAHLRTGAVVGADCIVGGKSYLAGSARVGDRCKINAMVYICSGVTMGDGVFVAANATFTNDFYPRACVNDLSRLRPSAVDERTTFTTVQDGVTIGAAATIGSDLVIGRFAVVGMGSVVTRSVAPYTLVVGSPARPMALVCRCARPFVGLLDGPCTDGDYDCPDCAVTYRVQSGLVVADPLDRADPDARGDTMIDLDRADREVDGEPDATAELAG